MKLSTPLFCYDEPCPEVRTWLYSDGSIHVEFSVDGEKHLHCRKPISIDFAACKSFYNIMVKSLRERYTHYRTSSMHYVFNFGR